MKNRFNRGGVWTEGWRVWTEEGGSILSGDGSLYTENMVSVTLTPCFTALGDTNPSDATAKYKDTAGRIPASTPNMWIGESVPFFFHSFGWLNKKN